MVFIALIWINTYVINSIIMYFQFVFYIIYTHNKEDNVSPQINTLEKYT